MADKKVAMLVVLMVALMVDTKVAKMVMMKERNQVAQLDILKVE